MSGFGVGHGIGLDPDMLAGQSGGAGGGGSAPVRVWVFADTAIFVDDWTWDGPIIFDGSEIETYDPEGVLETTNYEEFTVPFDAVMDIYVSLAQTSGGEGGYFFDLVDKDTGLNPFESEVSGKFHVHTANAGHGAYTNGSVPVLEGQKFVVKIYGGGTGNNNSITVRTWCQITFWSVEAP